MAMKPGTLLRTLATLLALYAMVSVLIILFIRALERWVG